MNNFVNFARRFQRGGLERRVIWGVDNQIPNIEQYIATNRYPSLPKIVVYSSAATSNSFLKNIFPFYSFLTPTLTAETDEAISRRIAEQVTQTQEGALTGAEQSRFGYLLRGFPFNANQALLLDRYLNGVNLAIHLKTPGESADYTASIQPLLNYYEQRGTLLSLSHSQESNIEEIQNALDEIRIKIKRAQ